LVFLLFLLSLSLLYRFVLFVTLLFFLYRFALCLSLLLLYRFALSYPSLSQRVQGTGGGRINIDQINILKSCGGSARESQLVRGYALNCTRASMAMPLLVRDARIACIDFSLRKEKLAMGYQVVVQDTAQLEAIRDRESDLVAEKIQLILASGANVLFSTKARTTLLVSEQLFSL
jgi:chaperonin GroEL (HSP60 family)